ncbi:hypothetical protein B0T26DRAFT_669873 [Lasiosphaeria miniovina]|uniref:Uncharacterized protein n=1 Tax=Lasiosphaeria miniovina TaxID=1954250 RepID=A0AA40BFV2_9PEZI|nr:uncharacterized protein B0T26DRAFT_669873 [Lasiosphaeria miniovina]KAK0733467.1 hypothetical protein B0T26DRAFT_669873 [Lasiosphaeria miniovina]
MFAFSRRTVCHQTPRRIRNRVVILERPSSTASRRISFDEHVRDCNSLQALDKVIRFATSGAWDIHNTTVLYAFSYQSDRNNNDRNPECHQLLAQILQAKKLRVMEREDVDFGDGHTAILIQSFHPSCAVNNDEFRPEYRALLIHHFIAAFAELHGKHELLEDVEDIRQLRLKKGQHSPKDTTNFASWEAAALFPGHSRWRRNILVWKGRSQSSGPTMDRMTGFGTGDNILTTSITKAMAYWEHHFSDDPLYDQVVDLLRLHGGQQLGWLNASGTTDNNTAPEMPPSLEA